MALEPMLKQETRDERLGTRSDEARGVENLFPNGNKILFCQSVNLKAFEGAEFWRAKITIIDSHKC